MGCSASKSVETTKAASSKDEEEGYAQLGRSMSMPVRGRDSSSKRDSHHVVALTSSTYGILKVDPPPHKQMKKGQQQQIPTSKSSTAAEEIYEKLKNFDVPAEMVAKPWSEVSLSLPKLPPVVAAAINPKYRTSAKGGEPETINMWELMDGLEDDLEGSVAFDKLKISDNMTGYPPTLSKPLEKSPTFHTIRTSSTTDELESTIDPDLFASFERELELFSNEEWYNVGRHDGATLSIIPGSQDEECSIVEVKRLNPCPLECFEVKCPPAGEQRVVLYTTSLRGIRKTFEDCNHVRFILRSLGLSLDERDVSMHAEFRQELKDLVDTPVQVPRVFVKGRYIGGADEVSKLHEDGTLAVLVEGLPSQISREGCDGCGGVRFVPCLDCSGSCKVITDTNEVVRCTECNENGLMRCPICD
ncbi:unnamed protein product [Sphagnum jensenii]|uniref:Glutaredoxin domain-containing protein n=1 Tax=Sphagnum jensenii TaxID=128206 RepID=A0ABP1AXQ2_9BRYO